MNLNRHLDQTKYGAIGRLLALVVLAILAMTAASPAQAQMGPSGSLTVQMRVGDALTEEVLDGAVDPGSVQNLALGQCILTSGPGGTIDYGVVRPLTGNKLPPLPALGSGFSVRCGNGTTCPLGLCPPPPPPEDIPIGVSLSSANNFVMSLGGVVNGGIGIAYEVYDANGTVLLSSTGGGITQGTKIKINPDNSDDLIGGSVLVKVAGPSPPTFRLVAGTYRDTMMVTYSF